MRWCPSMATAANLGGIGRRGLRERIEAKIEAEIVAGRAARVAMTGVPAVAVKVGEDPKGGTRVGTKVGQVAVDVRSMGSPKSNWRSSCRTVCIWITRRTP